MSSYFVFRIMLDLNERERRKEGKKERRKEGKKERRKEGKKERRKEGKREREKERISLYFFNLYAFILLTSTFVHVK